MNILITGTSRGLGFQTALELSSREGCQVFALSRQKEGLDKLLKTALQKHKGAKIVPLHFDLEHGNFQDLFLEIKKHTSHLDILINNAASIVVKPFMDLTEDDFSKVYKLNVIRTASLIRLLVPLMERTNGPRAHIVNISSMGGFQGSMKFAGLSAYSSSKAALAGLTESLAEELKEKHISANCLCLGAIQTEMLNEAFPGYQAPLTPEEMALYVADFALNGSKYFNGKILPVSLSTP